MGRWNLRPEFCMSDKRIREFCFSEFWGPNIAGRILQTRYLHLRILPSRIMRSEFCRLNFESRTNGFGNYADRNFDSRMFAARILQPEFWGQGFCIREFCILVFCITGFAGRILRIGISHTRILRLEFWEPNIAGWILAFQNYSSMHFEVLVLRFEFCG